MKKVFIVGGGAPYARMFEANGFCTTTVIADADILCFTGGEDVSPVLYGEPNVASGANIGRDLREMEAYNYGKQWKLPMVGICRGGQFLNVMSGGSMYQDVNNHGIGGTHAAYNLLDGNVYQVTSTHHQMMRKGIKGEVLVMAELSTRRVYGEYDENCMPRAVEERGQFTDDTECIIYRDTKTLCFQPHPEYHAPSCTELFFKLLAEIL